MNFTFFFRALLGLCIFSFSLPAVQWIKSYSTDPYLGPEIYHIHRVKEGGSKQQGTLYGIRIGYDHLRRYKLYWGMDALWAQGTLKGTRKKETPHGEILTDYLKSIFTDINLEGRAGYTFQSKYWRCASFTPYTGLGYFCENNCYKHPSPLQVHFKNRFCYVPFGFLSQIFITPCWSVGLNYKVRYILEATQKVEHDPEFGKLTQHYKEKLQYRIEIPFSYFFCWKDYPFGASLVPFFEYRSYGHRANFPFDFLEVKLKIYGATLKLHYLF